MTASVLIGYSIAASWRMTMKSDMIEIMSHEICSIFSSAPQRAVERNDLLFRADDSVSQIYLVQDGCLALERPLENGVVTCLQRAKGGDILAEASVYSDHYHCSARALEASTVSAIGVADFRRRLRNDPGLAESWAMHLARTVQATRFLSELRGLRTVSDRLESWIAEHGRLPEKGQWKSLAAELAVSHEAFYRELARRARHVQS